jgi:hypothetical protein
MKCKGCGLTYVGTVSKGRKVEGLTPEQLQGREVGGGRLLNRYYMCNGRNSSHLLYGEHGSRCPSRSIPAKRLEELVWQDVEEFLRNPGEILAQL